MDPAPLAKHGLTEELLKKLVSSAMACGNNTSSSLNASSSESRTSSGNVSIIVSVLSMLCRGSPSITHVSVYSQNVAADFKVGTFHFTTDFIGSCR